MAQQIIDIGVQGNDGTGDSIRTSFNKVNQNFTEIYAVFGGGGTIPFTKLSDAPSSYEANQVIMAATTGGVLTARDIIGVDGITIDATSDPTKLQIKNTTLGLITEHTPTMGASLNAGGFVIGNLGDPTPSALYDYNATYHTAITLDKLAVNKGYVDSNYVAGVAKKDANNNVIDFNLSVPVKARPEPTLPSTSDVDYDPTLTSNYTATEVLPRNKVVYRGGDSMTGKLNLNDHPGSMAGFGTPNGSDDLQAATKFYVDNNTYYSGVNLYVSATKGDDLQTKSPVGRQGRAWQYAYKTLGAAALAADNLISLSSTEPGPYRQTITYTLGPTQYQSTVQSVTLTGGNMNSNIGNYGYENAKTLLEANRTFIQNETIAYLNKKYVNAFEFNQPYWSGIINNILTAVGYDLALSSADGTSLTTYNVTTEASKLYNAYNNNIIVNQLIQIIDAVTYAQNQILNYSFSTQNLETYVGQLVDALTYDMTFGSNYQSIQAALLFGDGASTGISVTELQSLLDTTAYTVTGTSTNGSTVTLYFDSQLTTPYVIGSGVIVRGMTPTGYNGTYTVTGCTTTSVSFNSSFQIQFVSGGTVAKNNVINTLLNTTGVVGNVTATARLTTNAALINNIVAVGTVPTPSFPQLTTVNISTTGTIGTVSGSGPFIATISNMTTTVGLYVGAVIGVTGSVNDTGSIGTGTVTVTNINSSTSINVSATTGITAGTVTGITAGNTAFASASNLILNNLSFIQAELIAFFTAEYPSVQYNQTLFKRDIEYVIWSLIYDLQYGGNGQTVYSGLRYFTHTTSQLAVSSGSTIIYPTIYGHLTTLITAIVANVQPAVLYQQTVPQYINQTYLNGGSVLTSIVANINTFISIVSSVTQPNVNATPPDVTQVSSLLQTARSNIRSVKYTQIEPLAVTFINTSFPVINNNTINGTITSLFAVILDLLEYGIITRTTPSFNNPAGLLPDFVTAKSLILDNSSFIIAEAVQYMNNQFPGTTGLNDLSTRDLTYLIEAAVYDMIYQSTSATTAAALQYFANGTNQIPGLNTAVQACYAAVNHIQNIISTVAQNTAVQPTLQNTVAQTIYSGITVGVGPGNTLSTLFGNIKTIMASGSSSDGTLPNLTSTGSGALGVDTTLTNVRTLIVNNASTITNNTINYLSVTYTGGFNYNESTCFRDIGLMVDALAIDLVTGGNYQSVNAGKSYYRNASAQSVAIGTQLKETLDGITFAFGDPANGTTGLIDQVLSNNTTYNRYQTQYAQVPSANNTNGQYGVASAGALTTLWGGKTQLSSGLVGIILNIIRTGVGAAPASSFGTGIWNIQFNNGNNGFVDQGGKITPGVQSSIHIIPGKILVGNASGANGQIVSYTSGYDNNIPNDTITLRMTQPGFFNLGETIDFGETVNNLNITIFLESGIYYEDYPIKMAPNVTISGDDFRRTIVRPLNRISQSPWRSTFFYRDSVIDAIQTGIISFATDYASGVQSSATISGINGNITVTLPDNSVQANQSWLGLVFMDATAETGSAGKAVVNTVSGNVLNCTVIYPFTAITNYAIGSWHLYSTLNYGRHYLTNPLLLEGAVQATFTGYISGTTLHISNLTSGAVVVGQYLTNVNTTDTQITSQTKIISGSGSTWTVNFGQTVGSSGIPISMQIVNSAKNNKELDVFLVNDATRIKLLTAQGHGGFMMVLDPTGQIKTKSPYAQESASFSGSLGTSKRFAGGQFIDGFTGRLFGSVVSIGTLGKTITVTGQANSGLDLRPPQVPCAFYVAGFRYQINDVVSWTQNQDGSGTAVLTMDNSTPFYLTNAYNTATSIYANLLKSSVTAAAYDMVLGTNYRTIYNGLTYLQGANTYTSLRALLMTSGLSQAQSYLTNNSIGLSTNDKVSVTNSLTNIENIINNGLPAAPTLTFPGFTITTSSCSGTTATIKYTSSGSAPFSNGNTIIVNGNSVTGYNGTWTVLTSTATATTFSVSPLSNLSAGSGGSVISSASTDTVKAANLIQLNKLFIQNEIAGWISNNYNTQTYTGYSAAKSQRDTGYLIDAITYDLLYGGGTANSATWDMALSYYYGNGTAAAAFTGVINGTTLTISGTVTGTIATGQIIYGTGITPNTIIISGSGTSWTVNFSQTSLGTLSNTTTWVSGGASLTNSFTVASASGAVQGGFITGIGIPNGTTITAVNSNTITISTNFTTNATGSYSFYTGVSVTSQVNTNYLGSNVIICATSFVRLNTVLHEIISNASVTPSPSNQQTQITNSYGPVTPATQRTIISKLTSLLVDFVVEGQFDNDILGTVTASSNSLLNVSYNPSLVVGATITGTGIPNGTTISTVTPNTGDGTAGIGGYGTATVVISNPATISGTNVILTLSGTGTSIPTRTEPTISSYSNYGDWTTINNNLGNLQTNVLTYLNGGAGLGINIEMGGNKSMLANDFTQVNDLGYGILCTNAGLTEQVSTFTYYCHTGYWALNGAQIRSVAGSNSNGDYGLRATGYDLTELPDSVNLYQNMTQTAHIYAQGFYLTSQNVTATSNPLKIYIYNYEYTPTDVSEIEIDHTAAGGGTIRYLISTVSHTTVTVNGKNVLELDLSTSGTNGTSTTGLQYSLYHEQIVSIRMLQNFKFYNIDNVKPVRPSTALQFLTNLGDIYRIISYNLIEATGEVFQLGTGIAILSVDASFNYYKLATDGLNIQAADPIAPPVTAFVTSGSILSTTITIGNVSGTILTTPVAYVIGGIGWLGQTVVSSTPSTASFTANFNNQGVMTVTSSITGTLAVGMMLTGGSLGSYVYVTSLVGGSGNGSVWTVTNTTTFTGVSVTGTMITVVMSAVPSLPPQGPIYFTPRTQGLRNGDDRIAITSIASASEINQLNKAIYIFSWYGRTHLITGYTGGTSQSTGSYAANITINATTYTSSGTTLVVTGVAGTISQGQIVTGVGFNGTQYVQSVISNISGNTVNYVVTLTVAPTSPSSLSTGSTVYFGQITNSYISINPNSVYNNSAIGTSVAAMTYLSQQYVPNSTTQKLITFAIPYNGSVGNNYYAVLPPVDSMITVANQGNTNYNGTYQVTGITSTTQITVPYQPALAAGMVVNTTTTGSVVPAYTIIQSIDAANSGGNTIFTVSPACWLPAGSIITATQYNTVVGVTPSTGGSGYVLGDTVTVSFSGGISQGSGRNASGSAQANADGTITITVVDQGFGYTNIVPSVTITGGSGTPPSVTAILSSNPTYNTTASSGNTTTQMTLLYPTDPGTSGISTSAQASGNQVFVSTISNLSVGDPIIFSGTTFSNIVAGSTYYVLTTTANSGNPYITIAVNPPPGSALWTGLSQTTFTVLASGTASGSMTFYSPAWTNGSTVNVASTSTTINIVGGINSSITTITVASTSSFPSSGTIYVDVGTLTEAITYSGKTSTTFTGCVRGALGSTATSHINTASVYLGPTVAAVTANGITTYNITYTLSSSITVPSGSPVYYRINNNAISLYNGYWPTTNSAGSTSTLTLTYQFNPGLYTAGSTYVVTQEVTNATSNILGITKPFSTISASTLRAGYAGDTSGQITVRISTCRATGHDFLDIGTGGFDTTNYPNQIYGNPAIPADSSKQVVEETVGRVFHVSTDENGIFRVGRFFQVDQGTGTVTFAASIALSNLDGLGFKRGVVVSEFSTDSTMTENATDIVPTQSAIRGFVDLRLGLDYGGNPIGTTQLIGPGYMALSGVLAMKGNINVGNNYISNLGMPTTSTSPTDGANRNYVDTNIITVNSLFKLKDVNMQATATYVSGSSATIIVSNLIGSFVAGQSLSYVGGTDFAGLTVVSWSGVGANWAVVLSGAPSSFAGLTGTTVITFSSLANGNYLIYDSNVSAWKNIGLPTGDINVTYTSTSNTSGTLTTAIQANKITNAMVNASAAIAQTKLSLYPTQAIATQGTAFTTPTGQSGTNLGLASFDSKYFTATSGWVSLAASSSTSTGIGYDKLRYVSNGAILGNLTGNSATIQEISPGTVVSSGDGIKNANFSYGTAIANGLMTTTYDGSNTSNNQYTITPVSTTSAANAVLKADSYGNVAVGGLKVGGYPVAATGTILSATSTTLTLTTPGNQTFITAVGNSTSNTVITTTGTLDTSLGTLKATAITTGAGTTAGSVVGNWAVQSSSTWDVSLGTLKSITLTSGASGTGGSITGQWSLTAGSQLDASLGTLKSTTLTAGSSSTSGSITGLWSVTGSLSMAGASNFSMGSGTLDASGGTLRTITLSTGSSGVSGTVTGTWTVNSGSTFVATTIQNQANSATVTATSNNTVGQIVLRDSNGDFSARNITATLFTGSLTGVSTSVSNALSVGTHLSYASGTTYDGSAARTINIDATSANTASTIVARDGSNNFSAGAVTVVDLYTNSLRANNGGSAVVTGTWTLNSGASFQATYADLAEYYEGDQEYESGTVLVFGGSKEVTTTTQINDTRSAGVVTTNPAYTMNQDQKGIRVCIALAGRVPCKVVGRVKKGDMLTTSATPGYAVKALNPTLGSIIGKALEDKDYGEAGVIQVAVGRV